MQKLSTVKKGQIGENLAAQYFIDNDYSIVKRNLRTPAGEVDIIVYKEGLLSFVEVKHWSGVPIEDLEISISRIKQHKIIRCAEFFMEENPHWSYFTIRFDVFFLNKVNVFHFENAFTENGLI